MGQSGGVGSTQAIGGASTLIATRTEAPNLDHLQRLTGTHGLYEHALYDVPRAAHGYATDDNARALVVLARDLELGVSEIASRPYLDFVTFGVVAGGWHNRMSDSGDWDDRRGSDDAHGRAIWGLGESLARGFDEERVVDVFQAGLLSFDSTYPRSVAYATLGAIAATGAGIFDPLLERFLEKMATRLPDPQPGEWAWPEPRLTYDNARVPEALIQAGSATADTAMVERGLDLLDWLVNAEHGPKGFSFTPVGGRGPDDAKPGFDQQPIEAWGMADACFAAYRADGQPSWRTSCIEAADWFLGKNDIGAEMYDPVTGAGYDGLESDGVNQNRGAESTLAALGALIRRGQLRQELVH
jgi:hypothetical protein